MKLKMIAGILLIMLLVGVASTSDAAPWRHHRYYRYGWERPRPVVVHIEPPAPVVEVGGRYGGYYRYHHYYPHRYYGYRSYGGYRRW